MKNTIKRADIGGFTIKIFNTFIEVVFVKNVLKVIAINFNTLAGHTYKLLDLK
jgi:hypothetical protein